MTRRLTTAILAASVFSFAPAAFAQVDFNLGSLGAGAFPIVGTTVGATNDIDTYAPISNTAAIWDQDIIFQFTTTGAFSASLTSNDPDTDPDNDFFLLNSLTTTLNANSLRSATVVTGQLGGVFVSGSFGSIPAGTYFLVVDAWRGVPTAAGTPPIGRAGAFNATLSLAAAPVPPTVLYSGTIAATPTFFRPNSSGTAVSATAVGFSIQPLFVSITGTYSLEQGNSTFDDFMVLYAESFDPNLPLANLVEVDDDDGAGANSLITRTLVAGTQYFLVNSAFFAASTGAFNVVAGVPSGGGITLGIIPEPSSLALLAPAGLLLSRRRR